MAAASTRTVARLAIAIMGGLVVDTALTLALVPVLHAAWFRVRFDLPHNEAPGQVMLAPQPIPGA